MIEKRFINHDENVIDNINNEQLTSTDEIVTVMNNLNEENIVLKKELDDSSKLLDGLTIPELLELVNSLSDENQVLKEENKRLEKMNDKLADILVDNGLV